MSKQFAEQYFHERVIEMGPNYTICNFFELIEDGVTWGLRAIFNDFMNRYQSVYVYEQYRQQGYMTDYITHNKLNYPFITMTECNIEGWFIKHKVPYLLVTV